MDFKAIENRKLTSSLMQTFSSSLIFCNLDFMIEGESGLKRNLEQRDVIGSIILKNSKEIKLPVVDLSIAIEF